MLRDEHGMSLERRLLAVVRRVRRTQSPTYDIVRMAEDGIESLAFQVSQLFGAEPEPPPERRRLELPENLVDVLRRGPPSKQGHRRRADYDLILPEIPLQLKPVVPPPSRVQRFSHDFEHDNLVVHGLASAGRGALGGRAGESRQTAEPLGEMLPDCGIFFSGERPSAVVVEGQKYLNQMHEDVLL